MSIAGKKIMMLVLNTHEHDSRVERCAKALLDQGAQLALVCLGAIGQPEQVLKERHALGYDIWRVSADPQLGHPTGTLFGIKNGSGGAKAGSGKGTPSIYVESKKPFFTTDKLMYVTSPWLLIPKTIRKPVVNALTKTPWTFKILSKLRWWQKKVFQVIFLLDKIRHLDSLRVSNILRAILSAEFKSRQESYFRFGRQALALAQGFSPEIVHAHDFNTLPAARMIHEKLKIPYIYDSHELWVDRNRGKTPITYEEKIWEIHYERESIKKAAGAITVCEKIAQHLGQFHGVADPVVIRNTPYRVHFEKGKFDLRQKLGLTDKDVIGLYVGKITYNRGVMGILEALPHVHPDLKFVLLGYFDTNFAIEFWKKVDLLNLKNRVFHYGPVPTGEVSSWASSADFSVVSMDPICLSYFYTLPNKFFESIQAGLPILACRLPELENHIRKYGCGALFDNYNHDSLVANLQKLTVDQTFRRELNANIQRAQEELCWEQERNVLFKLYEKLLMSTSRPILAEKPIAP